MVEHGLGIFGERREVELMRRVLLTGLSGTGKSTLIERFATLGYKAVDLDADEGSEFVEVRFDADPQELARVLAQRDVIEPQLRRIANYEIDTSENLDEVMRRILDIVQK